MLFLFFEEGDKAKRKKKKKNQLSRMLLCLRVLRCSEQGRAAGAAIAPSKGTPAPPTASASVRAELCGAGRDGERGANGSGGGINRSCLQLTSESATSRKVSFPLRKMMLAAGIPFQAYGQVGWLKRRLDFFMIIIFNRL